MSPNTVSSYLKYVNLQMAAEAIDLQRVMNGETTLRSALVRGNDRRSQFTNVLADQFIDDGWIVLDHKGDTGTGFSGTLFKNKNTNELVVSFRSTEFIDDSARDSKATNELEIRDTGWAFGQIASMQDWFNELNADSTKLKDKSFASPAIAWAAIWRPPSTC